MKYYLTLAFCFAFSNLILCQFQTTENEDGSITVSMQDTKEAYRKNLIKELKPKLRGSKAYAGIITYHSGASKLKIAHVEENSPAAQGGIQKLDLIKEINGERVRSFGRYKVLLEKMAVGDSMIFTIVRDEEILSLPIIVTERDDYDPSFKTKEMTAKSAEKPKIVLKQKFLTAHGITIKNRADEKGVDIMYVVPESGPEAALQQGDILLAIYEFQTDDVEKTTEILNRYYEGDRVVVKVLREGQEMDSEYFIK
jgi:S1-C subfamily serine protease